MRAIAQEARVDAALIHHFYGSKEGVFAAAVGDAFRPGEILQAISAPGPGTVGERLVRSCLSLWDEPERRAPMLAVIKSAVTHDDTARLMRDFVTTQVIGQVVEANATVGKELRTALIGSEVIGMLIARYVFSIEPMASMAGEALSEFLGPVIDRFLTDDLDPALVADGAAATAPEPALSVGWGREGPARVPAVPPRRA
jgi:AcrR family transcriptional regulator